MARRLFSSPKHNKTAAIALLIAALVMIVDPLFPNLFGGFKRWIPTTFDPLMSLASFGNHKTQNAIQHSQTKEALIAQIQQLKQQSRSNQTANLTSVGLAQENERLRKLLALQPRASAPLLVAEVIGIGNRDEQVVIINKGEADGVYIGQVVLDNNGILGQVTALYSHSAKIYLLSDESQSISVRNARTGSISVVSGAGASKQLTVDFIPNTSDIKVGDLLYSSGIGTRYPANYPVGKVASIEVHGKTEFSDIVVTPFARFDNAAQVVLLGKNSNLSTQYAQPIRIAPQSTTPHEAMANHTTPAMP